MEPLVDLVNRHVHNESARKNVLKYCEVECGWLADGPVLMESFRISLENFKKEHPDVAF